MGRSGAAAMGSKHRTAIRRAFLGAGAISIAGGIALVLAEIGLRLCGLSWPVFRIADSDLGSRLRPGAEGWQTSEGRAHERINHAGMRDVERQRDKPTGVFRVALMGDSFTEAPQVDLEMTYGAVLE